MGITVPRYTGQNVGTSPLPPARIQPGRPSFGPDLSGTFDVAQQLIQHEQQKADQIRVNDAENQATKLRDQVLYGTAQDPHAGILNKRGHDAFAAPEAAQAQWDQGVKAIGGALNDRQRVVFQSRMVGYTGDLQSEIHAHIAKERRAYDTDTTESFIANRSADAARSFANDRVVEENLGRAVAALKDFATRNGHPNEWTQEQTAKLTSGLRLNVIKQFLTAPASQGGGDLHASAYLAAHRSEMVASDLVEADRMTEAGSVLGESQRGAASILKTATTLTDALRQAEQISDPKIQRGTKEELREHFADLAANDREVRNAAYVRSSKFVMQGGDPDKLPIDDRIKLSAEEMNHLVGTSWRLKHPQVETSPSYYQHWVNMAGISDGSRQLFLSHDFGKDRANGTLSESDFHYFTHLQLQLEGHDELAAAAATSRQYHAEENVVLKASKAARAYAERFAAQTLGAKGYKALPDSLKAKYDAGIASVLGPRPRVIVPREMIDSVHATPKYLDYLRVQGVDVDAILAAPQGTGPVELPAPKAPGAPINRNR